MSVARIWSAEDDAGKRSHAVMRPPVPRRSIGESIGGVLRRSVGEDTKNSERWIQRSAQGDLPVELGFVSLLCHAER